MATAQSSSMDSDPSITPSAVTVADNGVIWFRESLTWHARIARISTDGSLQEFSDPLFDYHNGNMNEFSDPGAFTADGDGLLVGPVIRDGPNKAYIRRIDRDGHVSFHNAPGCFAVDLTKACFASHRGDPGADLKSLSPNSIARARNGDLWFTSVAASLIGKLTQSGNRTIFTRGLTRWHSGPQFITSGPDGNMWFTEIRDRVGRITPDGRISEFSTGIPRRASLGGIVAGPDGNLWFTLYHGNVLGRITVKGRIALYHDLVYPSSGPDSNPVAIIVRDSAGRLVYNETQAGRIARVTLSPRH